MCVPSRVGAYRTRVHVPLIREWTQEIEKAGRLPERQQFINIAHMSDMDAAQLLNDMGAHIFVDFNGYLAGTRMVIPALEPCPICLHHFAQPSTMGARYIHNFLGDTVITPPEQQRFYTEKLIYLPV
jgi:protein O-GlcNAc transferase